MTLIKLGELVDKPRAKRIKLVERAEKERRVHLAQRERDEVSLAEEHREKGRQGEMSRAAYENCVNSWRGLLEEMKGDAPGLTAEQRALGRRLSHRAELKLVISSDEDIRRLPPGSFVAMGTSGLAPAEVRAVAFALEKSLVSGAAALRFLEMLRGKMTELPDYDPALPPTPPPIGSTLPTSRPCAAARGSEQMRPLPAPIPRSPASTALAQSSAAAVAAVAAATPAAAAATAAASPPLPPPPPPPTVREVRGGGQGASSPEGKGSMHGELMAALQGQPRSRLKRVTAASSK